MASTVSFLGGSLFFWADAGPFLSFVFERKRSDFLPSTIIVVCFLSLNYKTGQLEALNYQTRSFFIPKLYKPFGFCHTTVSDTRMAHGTHLSVTQINSYTWDPIVTDSNNSCALAVTTAAVAAAPATVEHTSAHGSPCAGCGGG